MHTITGEPAGYAEAAWGAMTGILKPAIKSRRFIEGRSKVLRQDTRQTVAPDPRPAANARPPFVRASRANSAGGATQAMGGAKISTGSQCRIEGVVW